jgi:hypothetical protein
MISYLLLLSFTDLVVVLLFILGSTNILPSLSTVKLTASFLIIHVLFLFLLLDMFIVRMGGKKKTTTKKKSKTINESWNSEFHNGPTGNDRNDGLVSSQLPSVMMDDQIVPNPFSSVLTDSNGSSGRVVTEVKGKWKWNK